MAGFFDNENHRPMKNWGVVALFISQFCFACNMASLPNGLNINDLLDDEDVDEIFTLVEEIASGSFGTVYKVCCNIWPAFAWNFLFTLM